MNLDESLREILLSWHKWRDYYYSDLKEKVITDDEWEVTRDKIDAEAIAKIKALVVERLPEEKKIDSMLDTRKEGYNQCLGEIRSIWE